jgi:CheY-like chemotaxis protein
MAMEKLNCILIADDDVDDLFFLTRALKSTGTEYPIITFPDGLCLINFLKENYETHRPVIIISDLNMPKKCGKETLKLIKSNPVYKQVPYVILSTAQCKEEIRNCFDLGATVYLEKPNKMDDLDVIVNGIKAIWIDNFSIEHKKNLSSENDLL